MDWYCSFNQRKRGRIAEGPLKPNDYVPKELKQILSEKGLETDIKKLVKSLRIGHSEIDSIQKSTIGCSSSKVWHDERKTRLTASNAAKVFNLKPYTNPTCTLKAILYPDDLSGFKHVQNGAKLAPEAKQQYTLLTKNKVADCGLFIYKEDGILAATPTGLIGDDGILKVVCISCKPEDVPKRKDKFLINVSGSLSINKKSNYFQQIVMQLHVTGRMFCDFFVFHQSETMNYYHYETINREGTDDLWESMRFKLIKFFQDEMAPELVAREFRKTGEFRVSESRKLEMAKRNKKTQASDEQTVSAGEY